MKNFVAFLLCFVMILLLVSCAQKGPGNDTPPVDNKEQTPSESPNYLEIYKPVLEVYDSAIDSSKSFYSVDDQNANDMADGLYGLEDSDKKQCFLSIIDSVALLYGGYGAGDKTSPYHKLSYGYAIKDLNGDEVDELVLLNNGYDVIAVFSYADGKPVMLGNYTPRDSCWIDGDGAIHNYGSSGASHSTNAVYRIADGGKGLELVVEYGTNGHEWKNDVAYTIYYKLVNGEKTAITEEEYRNLNTQYGKYHGSVAGVEATEKYSGLVFTPMYTEAEIAMEMYGAVINDEIFVADERLGEIKLKDLPFQSNNTKVDESKLLMNAVIDIDRDGINEYVIKSPDNEYIILSYRNGKVYSYYLGGSEFYEFNTDGTFYWYDSSTDGLECGLSEITFDKETLSVKSVYSIKYSSTATNYEYYVEGEAASEDEYYDYREQNIHKERVKFSQFEPMCSYPITAEQAWNLANAYWNNQDGSTDAGAGTIWTTRVVLTDTPNSGSDYYRVALQVEWNSGGGREGHECMPPHHIQSEDQILVNAFTGEITAPTCESQGKSVSTEEAIEIAKKYWEAFNIEENGYRVEHAFNSWASDSVYVIVIKRFVIDHYSTFDEIWIDKTTGATIIPYDPDGTAGDNG